MLFKYLPGLILRQNKDLCPSQCMQSAFKIQEYLLLKVHVVEYVHKLLVLGGYLYCGELYPSRLPKKPGYVVRFTIKTPILCLQYNAFR